MEAFKLIGTECGDTGETGLLIEGLKQFCGGFNVAHEGLIVAHDIMEHQQGLDSIGSIGDEMLALGGVQFVRGWTGRLRKDNVGSMYTPAESLASDLVNMGQLYLEGGIPMREVHVKVEPHDMDCEFKESCNIALRDLRSELEDYDKKEVKKYLKRCKHLMRRGYDMAATRFNNDHVEAENQFWSIAECVDDILSRSDIYVGAEFIITPTATGMSWEEHHDFDDEDY